MGYLGSKEHKENTKRAAVIGRAAIVANTLKRKEKYLENPQLCTNCSQPLKYDVRKKKFCSHSCAAAFHNKQRGARSTETKQKISLSLQERIRPVNSQTTRVCIQCENEFKAWPSSQKKICSVACANIYKQTAEYKKKMREKMQERIASGEHKGFSIRYKMKPSFGEQYFIDVFKNEGLEGEYEREMAIKEKGFVNTFVDFVFHKQKIALEVDGQHHRKPEQQMCDKRKDEWLIAHGYQVVRVPWEGVNSPVRLERLRNNVKKLLLLLK